MSKSRFSIVIDEMFAQDVMRVFEVSAMPLITDFRCACCASEMHIGVSYVGPQKNIRVGICDVCGYVGYIDRPTQEWLHSFYVTKWDTSTPIEDGASRVFKRSNLLDEAHTLDLPKSTRVFEIGVGYGQLLEQFKGEGFSHLFGIEHSPHRADATAVRTGSTIYSGAFGDEEVMKKIGKDGPYGLIVSKSVLEHVYDPEQFFKSAASIQENGDYVLIIVPNVWHESTPQTLFFLPHLHGFTDRALATIAYRCGYRTLRVQHRGMGLLLTAQKDAGIASEPFTFEGVTLPFASIEEKWCQRLQLAGKKQGDRFVLWWSAKDPNLTGVVMLRGPWWLRNWYMPLVKAFFGIQWFFPLRRLLLGLHRRSGSFVIEINEPEKDQKIPLIISMNPLRLYYK